MNYQTEIFFDGPTSQTEAADIEVTKMVIDAFWYAVDLEARSGSTRHPIECCLMSALVVRDVLHHIGRRDATVMRSGLDIRMIGGTGNIITVGSIDAKRTPGLWNAHMVVRLGNLLVDPTIGQARRPWNVLPHSAIWKNCANSGKSIELACYTKARVTTSHRFFRRDHEFQVSYFKLPLRSDLMTKSWRSIADACDDRRRRLVQDAVAVLQAPHSMAA